VAGFIDSLKQAVRDTACQALDASEAFGNGLVYAYQEWTGLTNVNPPNFASIAKGFLCGNPTPILPPGSETPQGGQCDCVLYRLTGYATRNNQVSLQFSNAPYWGPFGPITPIAGGFNPPFQVGFNIVCRGPGSNPCGPLTNYPLPVGASDGNLVKVVITQIRRDDGLPDDCGEPPPPVVDPVPPTGIPFINIPIIYAPNTEIDFNLNALANIVFFQPKFNFNGQLIIPFTLETNIDLGGINFNVTGNLNVNTGDVNLNFNGGDTIQAPGYDSPCDEPTKPVRPAPEKPPDVPDKPDDPDVEQDEVIVGVLVTVTNAVLQRKASLIPQGANPVIYAPALGFVNFFCKFGQGNSGAWTADIPVKNKYQLIQCPWDEGAIGVAGTPNPGVSWSLTPIKRKRDKIEY